MKLLVLLLVVQLLGIAFAKVTIPTIHGAGKTSADALLTTWASSFSNATQGRAVAVYNTSANATIGGSTNFVASEISNLMTSTSSYFVPASVYGVTVVYSFSELDGTLNLTANIIAGILVGNITTWTDQSILNENPGITISGGPSIRLVLHNDSSETYALTNYLSSASTAWTLGAVRTLACPTRSCTYSSNNSAVLQSVNKGANSLGFVLLGSAVTYPRVARACIQNSYGFLVSPDVNGLMSAVNSTNIPTDGSTITVVNAPGNYSYPIAGFIYLYIPQDITNLGSTGTATLAFLDYVLSNATQMVGTSMNFYPIPSAVDSYALGVVLGVNANDDQDPTKIWPGVATAAPTTPSPVTPAATPTPASSTSTTSGAASTTRNFAGATACSVLAAISFVACVAYDLNRRRLAGLTIIENDIYK